MAWAFGKVNGSHEKLFTASGRAAERMACEFSAQGLANTAWAFATVNGSDAKLL